MLDVGTSTLDSTVIFLKNAVESCDSVFTHARIGIGLGSRGGEIEH